MNEEQYLEIRKKYGDCASWALWAPVGATPKSNVGDLSIFDHRKNPHLLEQLNPNILMVGLNIARPFHATFANFHDAKSQSQDYKLRHTFQNTRFSGAYMTDVIKYLPCEDSKETMRHLRANPNIERESIARFRQELVEIKAKEPLIIAFGRDAFTILRRNLGTDFRIVQVTHYSHYVNLEIYRNSVIEILDRA